MLLCLAAALFLGDVAVRRVSPDFERMRRWPRTSGEKLRGREVAPPTDYMEKLKGRKAEVADQLDRTRAATRFEPPPPTEGTTDRARRAPVDRRVHRPGRAPRSAPRPRPPASARARRSRSPRAIRTAS